MGQPDSITDELRTDILEGRFEPGDRLVELRLTNDYGCGRLAVRTALVELAAEGLVDREVNRGATVRDVSINEAIQITQARSALESLMASEAARLANDVERNALGAIGDDMEAAVAAGDLPAYSVLNGALHRYVREISDHTVASHLVAHLRNRGAQHRYRLSSVPGRAEQSLKQHRAIIDAIVAGDEASASEAMELHLASVIETLRAWPQPDVTLSDT